MLKTKEKFLQDLLNAPSPSGFEQPAAKVWRARVKDHVDQIIRDVHGNSIAVLNPKAPFKVMITGHIDEIGLMITHIDEKGFLSVGQIGGMDPSLLVGQRLKILTAKGIIPGVIGRKAIHLMSPEERTKGVKMENIWVDIGVKDKKEAEKMVSIGDPMVIDVEYQKMGDDLFAARGC
ncbi:MAG: M42 family peptidase, partial [Phycisphaerae bacterium]|nr:M42 family peptidase [Phycisphaerae bacterium]